MKSWTRALLFFLTIVGVGISGYLSWVKLVDTEAFCGGVGNCSAVQNSSYGYFLGLPVAYLGFLLYAALFMLALYNLLVSAEKRDWSDLLFFALAVFGVAFSTYLTYTEVFLLHEICPWCVASFVNLILIVILAAPAVFGQPEEAGA